MTNPSCLSPSLPLSSPCGKKFRSKPQIARFLGDAADLTVFDFSRAGTPGDGSSRRRARDRSTRRAVEVARQGPPPVRPLSINPLRPSGPIRRTCGVIKLPVTWVPAPCEEELKMCALVKVQEAMDVEPPLPPPLIQSAPAALPASPPAAGEATQSQLQPTNQEQPRPQPQPSQALPPQVSQAQPQPPPETPPQPQPPVLPKPTSVVMVPALWENRLRGVMVYDYETGNEIKISPEKLQNGLSNGETATGENHLSVEKSTLSALLNKQLSAKIEDKKQLASSVSAGNIVPSLLAHGKNVPRQLGTMVPSLKTIKENGSLIASPQQNSLSGGNIGGNIVLTLPTLASANSYKPGSVGINSSAQQRNLKASIVPGSGRAVTTTKPAVPGLYVSDSELRRQEEKVQLLRKQLMAAQSTI